MIYRPCSVILAPLSGYTDLPFRMSARRFGCEYAFTEMIDAGSLVFGNDKTTRYLDRDDAEKWLGAQLVGSDPETLKKAVEILNSRQFELIDFNLGCPAPKVARKGEGAALAKRFDDALRAFDGIARTARIPVTAKIRILDISDPAPTIKLCEALVNSGARAITIHGRIQKAFYSGPVYFDIIKSVKESVSCQIIANGGIVDVETAREIRCKTTCDEIMLARGAMGNPWLFRELTTEDAYVAPTIEEFSDELEKHVLEMIDYYGEELALKVSRKMILQYMRGRGFPGELKSRVSQLSQRSDFMCFMDVVREGPSDRYWTWTKGNPNSPRLIRGVHN